MKRVQLTDPSLKHRIVWIGHHEKLGYFLYDENSQSKVLDDRVRTYIFDEARAAVFKKELVRNKLLKITDSDIEELDNQIKEYETAFLRGRRTHCYRCKKNLDEVNFAHCKKCKWMRCECGACGCGYKKRVFDDLPI